MTADDAGSVGEPVRVHPIGRAQQQSRRVDRPAGDHHDVGAVALLLASAAHDNLARLATRCRAVDAFDIGAGQQRYIGILQGRLDAGDMCVGLGLHEARVAVAGRAPDAGALVRARFVEHDPHGQRKRAMSGPCQVIGELPNARLVRDGGMRIRIAGGRLGRIAAARTMHMIKPLRLGVVGRQVLVGERPGRRDPVGVPHNPEIALAQPQQHRAVHFRIAADPVVYAGMERLAVFIVPGLVRLIAFAGEDRFAAPVLPFARQIVAALEDQDALAGGGEPVGEGAAPSAAADDDDVITISAHDQPPWPASPRSRSGRCSGAL